MNKQIKWVTLKCRKYLFVFSFGFIALLGLYNTVNYGLASLNFYSVQNTLSAWRTNKQLLTEESYSNAKQVIATARQRHPGHPLYIGLLAQVYEWGAIAGYEDRPAALEVSKQLYLKETKMRPTWPVSYASLAMNKWLTNEFDAELVEYLRLANRYGPKKAEVNVVFVELGLALYAGNHPFYNELRPYMSERLSQGMRNPQSRERVLFAIENHKAKRTVCRWLKDTDEFVSHNILRCNNT
ncbi:MAG: hypothetical protein ACI9O6_002958 [Glaciecola sp.]|jgi:hypothetical protein